MLKSRVSGTVARRSHSCKYFREQADGFFGATQSCGVASHCARSALSSLGFPSGGPPGCKKPLSVLRQDRETVALCGREGRDAKDPALPGLPAERFADRGRDEPALVGLLLMDTWRMSFRSQRTGFGVSRHGRERAMDGSKGLRLTPPALAGREAMSLSIAPGSWRC